MSFVLSANSALKLQRYMHYNIYKKTDSKFAPAKC